MRQWEVGGVGGELGIVREKRKGREDRVGCDRGRRQLLAHVGEGEREESDTGVGAGL